MISILVPVYNAEPYLKRCVDSILAQTYKEFELLLMDDGSTDGSAGICDDYAKIDSRVRVFHKRNEGVGAARNQLIEKAKGEFIGFVDSDDYVEPEMFEVLLNNLMKTGADISVCAANIVGVSKPGKAKKEPELLSRKQAVFEFIGNGRITRSLWDKLYKAELFQGVRFAEIPAFEDMLAVYELLEKCEKIVLDSRMLYNYVITPGSLMRSKLSDYHLAELDAQKELGKKIGAAYPEMIPKLEVSELKTKIIIYNRIIVESPELHTLYSKILNELKANFKKVLISEYSNAKLKAMIFMIKFCNPLYKICIRAVKAHRALKHGLTDK
ncbi:MAG: glycosyltransferase family 2 protein [Burkholderiales bacterium]